MVWQTTTRPPKTWWLQFATPRARAIVRSVLQQSGRVAMGSQEIYSAALAQFPDELEIAPAEPTKRPSVQPPVRDHPIRSVRFLKKTILEDMEAKGEIAKVHWQRGTCDAHGAHIDRAKAPWGALEAPNIVDSTEQRAWLWMLNPAAREPGFVDAAEAQYVADLRAQEEQELLARARKDTRQGATRRAPHRRPDADAEDAAPARRGVWDGFDLPRREQPPADQSADSRGTFNYAQDRGEHGWRIAKTSAGWRPRSDLSSQDDRRDSGRYDSRDSPRPRFGREDEPPRRTGFGLAGR